MHGRVGVTSTAVATWSSGISLCRRETTWTWGSSYDFVDGTLRGLTLHAGAENVTDEAPPIFPSWTQANTDPGQYDVLGRSFYLRLQYAFM